MNHALIAQLPQQQNMGGPSGYNVLLKSGYGLIGILMPHQYYQYPQVSR